MEREQRFMADQPGFFYGLSSGGLLVFSLGFLLLETSGAFEVKNPLLDCNNGVTKASIDILLKNKPIDLRSISGNKNISISENPNGSLTVNITGGNVNVNLNNRTFSSDRFSLLSSESLTFEDDKFKYQLSDLSKAADPNIELIASCKNSN